ncbi:MAG: hypothetical protein JWN04_1707 [Myxococcaceae bacterium]|nr:hypothetical protein [Myxococcaceae bacterium]
MTTPRQRMLSNFRAQSTDSGDAAAILADAIARARAALPGAVRGRAAMIASYDQAYGARQPATVGDRIGGTVVALQQLLVHAQRASEGAADSAAMVEAADALNAALTAMQRAQRAQAAAPARAATADAAVKQQGVTMDTYFTDAA